MGLLSPLFREGTVCTWQTPLTPNVTLALRYSPELAAPVGKQVPLGSPRELLTMGFMA